MLEKKPTLLILEFLTVSPSVPKERHRALSPPPPVFLLHFKTKLQYYKESMGPDSSLPYSNFAQAHCRQSHSSCLLQKQWGKTPALPASVIGWQILVLSPSPPADTGERNTSNTRGGGMISCSPLPPWAALLITNTLLFGDFTEQDSLFWRRIYVFFRWDFFKATGIGGFWLRKVDFVPVLAQKKAVEPRWGKLLVWEL